MTMISAFAEATIGTPFHLTEAQINDAALLSHPAQVVSESHGEVYVDHDGVYYSDYVHLVSSVFTTRRTVTVTERFDPEPQVSLAQFKERFRTIAQFKAMHAGVAMAPVQTVLNRLEVPQVQARIGAWLANGDRDTMNQMPRDSVWMLGNVDMPGRWSLFAMRGGAFSYIAGQRRTIPVGAILRCVGLTDVTANASPGPWEYPTDPSEATLVSAWKGRAWELGVAAKSDQRWCGDFEYAMGRMGITVNSVPYIPAGTQAQVGGLVADRDELRAVPIGTRIEEPNWHATKTGPDQWLNSRGQDCTASNIVVHPGLRYTVIPFIAAVGDLVRSDADLVAAPNGTIIEYVNNTRNYYTKDEGGVWRDRNGSSYTANQFVPTQQYRYSTVPTPPVMRAEPDLSF